MAASTRKFHRTKIVVWVLSEEPYDPEDLGQVAHDIGEGECSGSWGVESTEEIDGAECAKSLEAQGSEPGFFRLTADGEDAE